MLRVLKAAAGLILVFADDGPAAQAQWGYGGWGFGGGGGGWGATPRAPTPRRTVAISWARASTTTTPPWPISINAQTAMQVNDYRRRSPTRPPSCITPGCIRSS